MKANALAVVLVLLAPCRALAQETATPRLLPYTFGAGGGTSGGGSTIQFGGGLETIPWKGIGVGAEFGYMAPFPTGFDYGIGILSLNGLYEPFRAGRRLTPFITGGYSLGFREGHGNAINFGGGFNYWIRDGPGLEFRDHLHPPLRRGVRKKPAPRLTGNDVEQDQGSGIRGLKTEHTTRVPSACRTEHESWTVSRCFSGVR